MKRIGITPSWLVAVAAALLLSLVAGAAQAMIDGITGTTFSFTAKADYLSTGDGNTVLFWGFANESDGTVRRPQYPGPTLILNQGDTVTIKLKNELPVPVSIVLPGHAVTTAEEVAPTAPGLLTLEASPGGTAKYTFTATHAGTYLYHSGSRPELQVEMGLVGAIVVRPYGFNPSAPAAYGHPGSAYDHEYLFLLTEMDPRIHETVEFFGLAALDGTDYLSDYFPNYWFINGRTAPDTMAMANSPLFPTQPYDSMPRMHPGDRLLMRVVTAGRDLHPFHHHGNHARIIARDGRMLESAPGAGPDLSHEVFTIASVPGETVDAIFEWTGKGLGWDIYGTDADHLHTCNGIPVDAASPASAGYDPVTKEYCPDHGKPFPVALPGNLELTFGGFYSGSPFLGTLGSLPPGEGGLNPNAGFVYMWHSHTEKELTNWDIFPGGLMTMLVVEPPGVPIP